ncbi:MAG TPA: 16S rRNA (cytidine(1402)-2'-O)-methyltransferase [Streptosporangiaceae bacterium]|nr:16S rRNA (cytidine(1402)-2'-O)-methyltransferase [Streptosporangiaceae bacterium]
MAERDKERNEERDAERDKEEGGVLTLAAVPIGQAEDASPRLAAELARATIIAAEDTRRVRWLASSLEITLKARIVSYYDAVETRRTPGLLSDLQAGQDVLLVTDAGTPGISDPGYRLVAAAAAAGIRVTALPGPSAVTTALAVSGLPTDRFCFEGFPPRRAGDRQRRFAELAADRRTQVYFESARRLAQTLTELAASHGEDRQAVVCRELTKTHEEIVRGPLAELASWAGSGAVRGEITLVVAGTGRRGTRGGIRDGVVAGPGNGPGGRGPGNGPGRGAGTGAETGTGTADRPPHRLR